MAALTWRDVAAPSFGGANQAYQGAGATLDRALSGLSEGLKQFSTDNQAGVDNAILAKTMQIQDPAQLRQAISSGSLLQGVDLTKVNPKVLELMGKQVSTLLGQAATEQSTSSSKTSQAATQQNIDFSKQDQTRKTGQLALEDAARPQIAGMMGLTGAAALLSGEDQQKLASTRSSLVSAGLNQQGQRISNDTGSFTLAKGRRDDAAGQDAISAAADAISNNATIEGIRSSIENTVFKSPQAKLAAIAQAEKMTGQPLYAPVDAPVVATAGARPAATGGAPPKAGAAKAKGGAYSGATDTSSVSSPEARDVLAGLGRTLAQRSSPGVVADIEKNLGDTRSAPEVAAELAASFPEVEQGKLAGLITEKMSANKNLSAADVGSALMRSTTGNYWGSTRFADGMGVDDKSFTSNLNDMATGNADYMSAGNQTVRAFSGAVKSADKNLEKAKSDLSALQRRQRSQPGIDTSDAEDRVQRSQQALDSVVQKYRDTPEFQPVYKKPEEPPKRKPIRVPR